METALEILKYVLPLVVTGVLSLVLTHFRGLQSRVERMESACNETQQKLHRLELVATEDRARAEAAIKTATAEIIERLSQKFVPMGAYLNAEARLDKRLEAITANLNQIESKLDQLRETNGGREGNRE
ncbi:MAG: hypothetical protein HUU55_07575 [Myxococcales bacterium]|nr:hypothetical protein [Myxococcales bacterium]